MKKQLLLLVLVTSATLYAAIPTGYYNAADGKKGEALRSQLKSIISANYNSISYSGLEPHYEQTDMRPNGYIWDMYSTCSFTMSDAGSSQHNVCDCWNKEHSVPQSWFSEQSPMKSDLFHVYPTDARVNNFRGNLPYGETSSTANIDNNSHALGHIGTSSFAGYSGKVYEPDDEYKGDFARTYFYMSTRYMDRDFTKSNMGSVMFENGADLTSYSVALLLKWHRQDPVSQKEIDRNNAVYLKQHNRNPFIDYPYLAEYIWGEHAGETVDMSHMMSSSDIDFVPGVSNGWRSGVVPPQPGVQRYGVTWLVNGEEIQTDSVAENQKPASLPAEPESCSTESNVFVGWSNTAIDGTQDDAPAVLYTRLADFPAVTTDITYYAVFAQQVMSEVSLPTTYIFDADHQEDWTNTATAKGSYWLLETGKSIVSPEIDLAQLNSIVVKMRTYGGSQNDQLDIYEADGKLVTMTATEGSSITEYTWNNNLYIAGISALTFSSDYGQGKGIGIQSITINAGSASEIYVRYITSCQSETEVQLVQTTALARKMLIGGQIYILVGEQMYTITGQKVR